MSDEKTPEEIEQERKDVALAKIEKAENDLINREVLKQMKVTANKLNLKGSVMDDLKTLLAIDNPFVKVGDSYLEAGTKRTPSEYLNDMAKERPSWFEPGKFPFKFQSNPDYLKPTLETENANVLTNLANDVNAWLR